MEPTDGAVSRGHAPGGPGRPGSPSACTGSLIPQIHRLLVSARVRARRLARFRSGCGSPLQEPHQHADRGVALRSRRPGLRSACSASSAGCPSCAPTCSSRAAGWTVTGRRCCSARRAQSVRCRRSAHNARAQSTAALVDRVSLSKFSAQRSEVPDLRPPPSEAPWGSALRVSESPPARRCARAASRARGAKARCSLPILHDPFDRLIAGTAVASGLPLITRDARIAESGRVRVLW